MLKLSLRYARYAATMASPVMRTMLERLSGLPFTPMFVWRTSATMASIGLGDVLLATLFPLVMWKAFCRTAGLTAIGVALLALVAIFVSPLVDGYFPAMVVLGPLMLVQYVVWRWQRGPERTTKQFRQAAPAGAPNR